ncbi:hypothetical protein FKW77_003623 [Venturia effusa]|uniref:Mid2 domain-containing protein n=1 Tax=Venturia effusa TaxID=50376 RepID=A0A517L323_9PEZI|nr:hypothetical protein FKW77_003623 [Venturia effusa]
MQLHYRNATLSPSATGTPNQPPKPSTTISKPTKPPTWSTNGDGTIGLGVGIAVFFILATAVGFTWWSMRGDRKKAAREGRLVDQTPLRDAHGNPVPGGHWR